MAVGVDPKSHKSVWPGMISDEKFYLCKLEKPQ